MPKTNPLEQMYEQDQVRAEAERLARLTTDAVHQQAIADAGKKATADIKASQSFNKDSVGADGKLEASASDAQRILSIGWLNAYNAPHWMDIGSQMQYQGGAPQQIYRLAGWNNTQNAQIGGSVERFGTSWMYDLMQAQQFATPALRGTTPLRFNGATDANHGFTPTHHATHDLGMAFDLGVSHLIDKDNPIGQRSVNEQLNQSIATQSLADSVGIWSNNNAAALDALLPGTTNNNQRAALLAFLSIYDTTQSANGSWDNLRISSSGDAVKIRTALFGSGIDATSSLISKVLIGGNPATIVGANNNWNGWSRDDGQPLATLNTPATNPWHAAQNPYRNMREILSELGVPHNDDPSLTVATTALDVQYVKLVKNGERKWIYRWAVTPAQTITPNSFGGVADHHNHFHIYLRTPERVDIELQKNLLVDSLNASESTQGDQAMFTMDMPDVHVAQMQQMMMVAQAAVPKAATQVAKTMWLGGEVILDFGPTKGQGWNVGEYVCDSLKAEGWFRRSGLNAENPKCVVKFSGTKPKTWPIGAASGWGHV